MASEVNIANRALQKLGAGSITYLTQDSVNARACNSCYTNLRDALLRSHPWNFAITRTSLAADATAPTFGRASAYTLPSDCLRLLPSYPEDNSLTEDYQIEGRKIYSDYSSPLYIRYIYRVTDVNEMDVLFQEALATKMAFEMCEQITQSNSKKESLREDFKSIIQEAKKLNAFENVASEPPEDEWNTVRI